VFAAKELPMALILYMNAELGALRVNSTFASSMTRRPAKNRSVLAKFVSQSSNGRLFYRDSPLRTISGGSYCFRECSPRIEVLFSLMTRFDEEM